MTDIASQIGTYRKGFEANGVETLTAIYERHSTNVTGSSDFTIHSPCFDGLALPIPGQNGSNALRHAFRYVWKDYIWEKALKECDTFMFMWSGFEPDYSHYARLKAKGKRIITNFVGSDIRWKPAADQEFNHYALQPLEFRDDYFASTLLVRQLHYLRMAEKYSDVIISLPNQAQLALRPYVNFYYPLHMIDYRENPAQRRENPVIIHAPTNREFKGTKYVLETFEKLEREGIAFQPRLLEKIPHNDILDIYADSDILIGQLLCPGGGKQAFELLACGNVVLTRMAFGIYPQQAETDSPIVDVGPETLYDRLKLLIRNHRERSELASRGRQYADTHHDVTKICKRLIDVLENGDENDSLDFVPDFFRDQFIPESPQVRWMYNKYNRLVKHCPWYRKFIKPGKRDGLVF